MPYELTHYRRFWFLLFPVGKETLPKGAVVKLLNKQGLPASNVPFDSWVHTKLRPKTIKLTGNKRLRIRHGRSKNH